MLTVYSSYRSPGASTTAIYLAAQWASTGRQVLLIEADGTAGTLSQKLGIQFTPGTASFMASGKPVTAASLVDHAQDVLFNDLHVMPTPSSPSGARSIAERFAHLGEELRDIADSEMAVIVDAGRLTPEARASELTTSAAAVLIVTRDNAQLPSLEHVHGGLAEEPDMPGPLGLVATVGPSPLKEDEWRSQHGLSFVGSVELTAERGTDLSMFMSRGKRKSRKLRSSIDKLADKLYEFAFPASASEPRIRLPSTRSEDARAEPPQDDAAETEAADEFGAATAPATSASQPSGALQDPAYPLPDPAYPLPDELAAGGHRAAAAPAADPYVQTGHFQAAPQHPERTQPAQRDPDSVPHAYGGQVPAEAHYGWQPYPEYGYQAPGPHPGQGGYVEGGIPAPEHAHYGHAAPPATVYQPNPEPAQPAHYAEHRQGAEYRQGVPAFPPGSAQQVPHYSYPEEGTAGYWQPGHAQPDYAPETVLPPPHQHPHETPSLTPEHSPYPEYPEHGVPADLEPEYVMPAVPTGSFRAWAEQLHGEQASADSGEPPVSPGATA
ncbi:hypothetical protein [Candidatus Poriferisodalis sp.]|uniref:tyrosine-protein kinase family protein n=1 Tax=Candidatus Poriferisodalis sp. TaxID=3101277 RepID=UPI003B02EA9E